MQYLQTDNYLYLFCTINMLIPHLSGRYEWQILALSKTRRAELHSELGILKGEQGRRECKQVKA